MTQHAPRTVDYLQHILDAIDRASRYVEASGDLASFENDGMAQDAVIRNLEILGEAAVKLERVAPHIVTSAHQIPWMAMRTMRNKVIHDYFEVDIEVVWNTVRNDLPALREQVAQLLAAIQNSAQDS